MSVRHQHHQFNLRVASVADTVRATDESLQRDVRDQLPECPLRTPVNPRTPVTKLQTKDLPDAPKGPRTRIASQHRTLHHPSTPN